MAPSVTILRVRYAETDRMGVVYYANYFVWFEVARTELLRQKGWSYREMEGTGVMLPVISAECQYTRPARYDDEIEIHTTGRLCSPVRCEFEYEVRVKGRDETVARGKTMHAAMNTDGRACRLPDRVREALT